MEREGRLLDRREFLKAGIKAAAGGGLMLVTYINNVSLRSDLQENNQPSQCDDQSLPEQTQPKLIKTRKILSILGANYGRGLLKDGIQELGIAHEEDRRRKEERKREENTKSWNKIYRNLPSMPSRDWPSHSREDKT